MSLRSFVLALAASFGAAWLFLIVIPYFTMSTRKPVMFDEAMDQRTDAFYPKRTGQIGNGAQIYGENGCYLCHTQLVRPTYAGNDLFRPGLAGLKDDPVRGDTRRETVPEDYIGEKFAQIGVTRLGPDLANLAVRVETEYASKDLSPKNWLYQHLYDPRHQPSLRHSVCPSFRFMFKQIPIHTGLSDNAIPFAGDSESQIVPDSDAIALVSYLLSLRKDQPLPDSLNFGPRKPTDSQAKN